jgi:RNA polymerase sigma-32 factor
MKRASPPKSKSTPKKAKNPDEGTRSSGATTRSKPGSAKPRSAEKLTARGAEEIDAPEILTASTPEILENREAADDDIIDVEVVSSKRQKDSPGSSALAVTEPGALLTRDPLAMYLAEVRRYPMMTPEQEREVALEYSKTKDPELAHKLVTSNLRFVIKIAAEYSKFGAKMIDLIQEGNVGLMHAVREFNPHKNVRLITYAVWWIRGYIREYLMKQYSVVRMGTTHAQRKLFYNLQQEEQKLDAMGLDANVPLLSSRLGVKEDEVTMMRQRMSGRDVSLDQPLDDESRTSLMDLQSDAEYKGLDDALSDNEQVENLRENLEKLRPLLNLKEIKILDERLLADEPRTLQEIGDEIGITRERARQLEARIIQKLKDVYSTEG